MTLYAILMQDAHWRQYLSCIRLSTRLDRGDCLHKPWPPDLEFPLHELGMTIILEIYFQSFRLTQMLLLGAVEQDCQTPSTTHVRIGAPVGKSVTITKTSRAALLRPDRLSLTLSFRISCRKLPATCERET